MEKNGTRGSSTSQGNSRSKSSSKDNSRSTVLNFFILKFNVFWVLLLGSSNCIFLGDFVQELPKGGDCKAKMSTKGAEMKIEAELRQCHVSLERDLFSL